MVFLFIMQTSCSKGSSAVGPYRFFVFLSRKASHRVFFHKYASYGFLNQYTTAGRKHINDLQVPNAYDKNKKTRGTNVFQDGMFHKNEDKKLEKVRMDTQSLNMIY